jgi:hypothetical protein
MGLRYDPLQGSADVGLDTFVQTAADMEHLHLLTLSLLIEL